MVTSLNKDTELDLAANPYWYGKKPKIKNVKIQIVTNDNTRVLLLQSKKVDAIENPPGNLIDQIAKNPGLQSDLFPSTRVDFIQLDQHYAPLKDQNVRLALNYGIDRNAIVKLAYSGHATPGSSFMPYKMLYWNAALKPPAYDLAKAKSYLAKSKYPNGFNIFLIEVANDVAGNSTAIVIKSELAKLGIKVDIQTYELLTAYQKEDGGQVADGPAVLDERHHRSRRGDDVRRRPAGRRERVLELLERSDGDEARPPGPRGAEPGQARGDVQADPEDRLPAESRT